MNQATQKLLLAIAGSFGDMQAAFVAWVHSFDVPEPTPDPIPVPDPPAPDPKHSEFTLATLGPSQVYAGHDLYFFLSGKRAAGNPENTFITVTNGPVGAVATLPDISRTCCGNFMWAIDAEINTSVCLSLPATLPPGDYYIDVEINNSRAEQSVRHSFTVLPPPVAIKPTFQKLPALSSLDKYNALMIEKGRAQLSKTGYDTWEGNPWYYDGTRVAYQIADYTGDQSFADLAKNPLDVYRPYVIDNGGGVPGYRVFPQGLRMHFERTGDAQSKQAALLLLNASYGPNGIRTWDLISETLSREVAYAIETMLEAEKLGQQRHARLAEYVDIALGHIDQWFVQEKFQRMAPFMFALTAEALVKWHEATGDPRVLPALKLGADWIWAKAWRADKQVFVYELPGNELSPDLNLLIVPVYGWLYAQTGDKSYIDKGDQIFAGGVEGAWLDQGKQFNQSYRWSMDYLKYRGAK